MPLAEIFKPSTTDVALFQQIEEEFHAVLQQILAITDLELLAQLHNS
jgi:hypothetical protein